MKGKRKLNKMSKLKCRRLNLYRTSGGALSTVYHKASCFWILKKIAFITTMTRQRKFWTFREEVSAVSLTLFLRNLITPSPQELINLKYSEVNHSMDLKTLSARWNLTNSCLSQKICLSRKTKINNHPQIRMRGLHRHILHIGSQIRIWRKRYRSKK